MLFDDAFLEHIKENPVDGVLSICELAKANIREDGQEWDQSEADALYEAYALIVELRDFGLIHASVEIPGLEGNLAHDCTIIYRFMDVLQSSFSSERSKLRVNDFRRRFKLSLSNSFAYEFSQGDLDRVQLLINELRELIAVAADLEDGHKQRLLRRLEKLQGELHKKVADLDRFWGLVGDAGVVLGKLGTDAKPIVDRIREIAGIVWQTQSRSEELPSGSRPPSIESASNE